MYKVIRSLMALVAIIGFVALVGCEDDSNDNGDDNGDRVEAFERIPSRDFDTLIAAGNDAAYGIWSDGTTMWVVDELDFKIYAYDLATKMYDASRDFDTLIAAGNNPVGLWSDGTTMWVADSFDDKIFAYNLATTERDASRDFDTLAAAGNNHPFALWSDGTTMWVTDSNDSKIFAYNLATTERDASRDFDTLDAAGNNNSQGIWSNGTTMWVSDFDDVKIFAYNLATTERDASRDFDTLRAAGNSPIGIWSDGTTMWVASGDKIFAYVMPATSGGGGGADDYPGDSSSTGSVSVGGSVTGEIETSGDEDWFRVSLTAGTVYQFDLEGSPTSMGTLEDTILDLYGTDGSTRLESNDDGGIDLNSRITYTPTTSGTYYLAALGFDSDETGTYTLSVIVGSSSSFSRVSARDFDTLIAAGNDAPVGLWSDETTMWVADPVDDKIFAYQMP